ncbi:cupin domain-containing protein [Methanoculleus sp.]|uniref:cupin domain-containing protein n=1 Tax=Methanoculleus sp. TaxID=90427 RepID=UPI0025E2ED1E|nr:cupin domain-containing protein [Methanoculleus sp.]
METDRTPQSDAPEVPYWHVWTDENGVSRQDRCRLTDFAFASVSEGAAPSWIERLKTPAARVVVLVLPAGWVGEWHENPEPQWIVSLSGRWFVETMDGTRVEMGPGELSFGNDQHTRNRQGHRSGTVGTEPAVLMLVQVTEAPGRPCLPK